MPAAISAGSRPLIGDGAWVRVGMVSAAVVCTVGEIVAEADTVGRVGEVAAAVAGMFVTDGSTGAQPA